MYNKANDHNNVYLSKYLVCEPHSEYLFKVDYTVIFTNEKKHIHKQIIDCDGNILEFPGVEYTEVLTEELGAGSIKPVVRYEAVFEKIDDSRLIMVWTVRPDGRYWMDSWGFGAEDYESLSLYSYIGSDGNFLMPFKLYSIGDTFYGDYRLKGD
jgi:hypothetical protein